MERGKWKSDSGNGAEMETGSFSKQFCDKKAERARTLNQGGILIHFSQTKRLASLDRGDNPMVAPERLF